MGGTSYLPRQLHAMGKFSAHETAKLEMLPPVDNVNPFVSQDSALRNGWYVTFQDM